MAFDKLECFGNSHEIVHIVLIAYVSTQVSVLYFAKSAELTGLKAENITVPSNITSLQLWQDLENRHPRWIIIITTTLIGFCKSFILVIFTLQVIDTLCSNRGDLYCHLVHQSETLFMRCAPLQCTTSHYYWQHCYYI